MDLSYISAWALLLLELKGLRIQYNAGVRHSVIQAWVPQHLTELPAFRARTPLSLFLRTHSVSSWLLPQTPVPTVSLDLRPHFAAHPAWFYLCVTPDGIAPDGTVRGHCDALPAKPLYNGSVRVYIPVCLGHKIRLTSQNNLDPQSSSNCQTTVTTKLFCSGAETCL